MKKIGLYIILVIVAMGMVMLFKNSITTKKYSHSDIVALINKGMQSMDNVYLEKDNGTGVVHYYFKGNNRKSIAPSISIVDIILEDGKQYLINKDKKAMFITKNQNLIKKGIQEDVLRIENLNKNDAYKDKFRYEFVYIRDEKIDNKDCIFVKEREYNLETKEYNDVSYNGKNEVATYWIEKSTGFVIGAALMEIGKDTATPQTMVTNIKQGEVTDDMFNDILELPSDYKVFEVIDGNAVEII